MSLRDIPRGHERYWAGDDAWRERLERDAAQLERCLPLELLDLHATVVRRAHACGASALILSGSTARDRRTAISDLDYHLIGSKIATTDLSHQLDLHTLSQKELRSKILAGDDFVHWSVRYGCVIFDDGTIHRALSLIAERKLWPDVGRKRAHAAKSLELAHRFVATGDEDGALLQVRTALSLAARARLLGAGVFPLCRAELPDQLVAIGFLGAAHALAATLKTSLPLPELAQAVREGDDLLSDPERDSSRSRSAT